MVRTRLGWDDEIVVDGWRRRVGDEVPRRMAHFAVAAARGQPGIFPTPVVHDLAYADGTQGRLESWTQIGGAPWSDDAAGLAALGDFSLDGPRVETVRRFAVQGDGFSASLRQGLTCCLPRDAGGGIAAAIAELSWSEMGGQAGALEPLLHFLRIAWSRSEAPVPPQRDLEPPVRIVRAPYRVKRQFIAEVVPATAVEVEDGCAFGRKLKLWEQEREVEDDSGDEPLRPRSRFIDFVEALSGDLMIDRRAGGGDTHSTLVFESSADARDFIARFAHG